MWKTEGEKKGSARRSVHWGCDYATALNIFRLIPNAAALAAARMGFGRLGCRS